VTAAGSGLRRASPLSTRVAAPEEREGFLFTEVPARAVILTAVPEPSASMSRSIPVIAEGPELPRHPSERQWVCAYVWERGAGYYEVKARAELLIRKARRVINARPAPTASARF
jgi:hypothetical protein